MVNIKNRWALVTGASRGIGYLTALFLEDEVAKAEKEFVSPY